MWKALDIYNIKPDRYIINDNGSIIDLSKKWFVNQFDALGYMACNLQLKSGEYASFRVHRLVIATFQPIKLVGKDVVNHKDLNKKNNYINNLEYTTDSENTRHAIRNHARKLVNEYVEPMYTGESNKAGKHNGMNSVFNEAQVHEICKMMEQNTPYPEILENLNLPVQKNLLDILTKIRSKKLWYCISKNYNIPNKEYRDEAIHYDDAIIKEVCNRIANGASNREIANWLGIDMENYKERDKFYHFIKRIRDKKTYTKISNKYF